MGTVMVRQLNHMVKVRERSCLQLIEKDNVLMRVCKFCGVKVEL